MSEWHAIMYPIRPGTEGQVRELFENVVLPRRKVYDENGDVLLAADLTDFQNGRYLSYDVRGDIVVRVTRLSGPNAVLSGIFLD